MWDIEHGEIMTTVNIYVVALMFGFCDASIDIKNAFELHTE